MEALLVDKSEPNLRTSAAVLESIGHQPRLCHSIGKAKSLLEEHPYEAVFITIEIGEQETMEFILNTCKQDLQIPVVVCASHSSVSSAVESMRSGAFDYIQLPLIPEEVSHLMVRIAENKRLRERVESLTSQLESVNPTIELSSNEPEVQNLYEMSKQAAASEANILLLGKSGTGKTVLARNIHEHSQRAGNGFVTVHCPSLSRDLLESELFGHVKGAFTGAVKDTWGKVAAANEGTLFLDEIGDLSPGIQSKLLRLLQERAFERVGETRTREADVRIIAATNVDLQTKAEEGSFREDLYYRLNVVSLSLPELAERPRDILPIARNYLAFFARQMGRPETSFSDCAEKAILQYAWPGNLRELRNVIERALIFCRGSEIKMSHLPENFQGDLESDIRPGNDVTLEELEKDHIQQVLERSGNVSQAAKVLGINTATLYRKRKRYGFVGN